MKGGILVAAICCASALPSPRLAVLRRKALRDGNTNLFASSSTPASEGSQIPSLGKLLTKSDEYKENSRAYRRTVFKDSDWVKFRSSDRLFVNLYTMFSSGTVRGLLAEIGTVLVVSFLVWTFNELILDGSLAGFGIRGGNTQSLVSLPVLPFQISSPALGLLLVFRTNTVYSRWNTGRLAFEHISYHAIDLVRQGMAYLENITEKEELARRVIVLLHAMKSVFRPAPEDEEEFRAKVIKVIGSAEAQRVTSQENVYLQAIQDITRIIRRSKSIDGSTKARFDLHLDELTKAITQSEGLKKTPVPLVYTRHTNRFLSLWLLLLPFALVRELAGSFLMIPVSCLVAIFFFGIEELGVQLEEPFSIMPLEDIVECAESSILQLLTFEKETPSDPIVGSDALPTKDLLTEGAYK